MYCTGRFFLFRSCFRSSPRDARPRASEPHTTSRRGFRVFLGVLGLLLFRGEFFLAGTFVGVPVGLASQGVLERFGIVSHRRGEVVARAVLKRKAKEVSVLFDASKNSLPKREKKNQKISQIWRRVKHRTHDVCTNGVDNKTNSLDLTHMFFFLNERMNA